MTDYVWPNGVPINECEWRLLSNSESTPSTFVGGSQNASRPGDRFGCTVRVNNASGAKRRKMLALAARLRGSGNRVFVPDHAFVRAGAWVGGELFSNADFSNGTTGWTAGAGAITEIDNVLRLQSTSSDSPTLRQQVALTQYAPHVLRSLAGPGRGAEANNSYELQLTLASAVHVGVGTVLERNYRVATGVALESGVLDQFPFFIAAGMPNVAGHYDDIHFVSLSRCMLVDGGGNLLLRSDEFDNATWVKTRLTVTANAAVAPDGTTTAEAINEDGTAANTHFVGQAVNVLSDVAEFTVSCSLKAAGRTWVVLQLQESTGSHVASAYLNLATGAIGTVTTTGANLTNLRATVRSEGTGWYRLTLTARKVSAATQVFAYITLAEADNDVTFSGVSAASVYAWRASLRADSVPNRGAQTTSAAVAIAPYAAGASAIYVKGGPASMSRALRVGDMFELDKLQRFATAPLDLDAAGCGYLQFEPSLSRSLADNTPIIIEKPMSRMKLTGMVEIPCRPGGWSDFEFEFEQDLQTS